MKTTTIKASIISLFISAALLGFTSCENKTEDHTAEKHAESNTEEVAKEKNDAKFNDNDDEMNAKFLVKAAEINLEEIALGKLAQEKSTNADVKALGKMMETAHTKGLEEVKALASKKGISIPTENTEDVKDAWTKLNDKTDQKDFNKAYADKMVSGHKDAIDLFEKHTDSKDADIKTLATSMLPELREHLDHSVTVQNKLEKK